ncbi:MAG: hypothetical protein ACRER2_06990 [Methylococcales bacterium]
MISLTDITGLFSAVLLVSTIATIVVPFKYRSVTSHCVFLLLSIGLCLIPLGPVPIAFYVRGLVGDLCVPNLLIQILTLVAFVTGSSFLDKRKLERFCFLLLPLALAFYPLSMGLGKYDPYSLGYGSLLLLGILFVIALLAWALSYWFIAISLSLSVFCYAIGWYESNNLWDYLIDPVLSIYALYVSIGAYRHRLHFGLRRPMAATLDD